MGTPSELVFAEVDQGVLTDLRILEGTDGLEIAPPAGGAGQVVFKECRTTWFGRFEFEFERIPGDESDGGTERRVIQLGLIVGDMGWGLATVEVDLVGRGRFVVPLANLDASSSNGDGETTGDTQIFDNPSAITCMAVVAGPEAVDGEAMMTAPLSIELKPPDQIHPADSIQGIIERLDPLDTDERYRPLAALAGYLPQFPVDVVYVVPDGVLESMTIEIEGTCIDLSSLYRDGTYVNQHTGCLDGRHEGTRVDDVWTVDAQGTELDRLQALSWLAHPGMQVIRDGNGYLDGRDLPEGTTEIHRAEVGGTLVSVTRHVAEDGSVVFSMEGVGVNSGGGGFGGETWNGCYQVQYQDAGYSMIVVADPTWSVRVDGQSVEIAERGGLGVAVVAGVFSQPEQLEIETAAGGRPECFDEVS